MGKFLDKKRAFLLITLALFLFALPTLLSLVQQTQIYLSEALGEPANIVVDVSVDQGPLVPIWQALAQGGEEKETMLTPVIPQIQSLKPQYIRLDHIYDFYEVVNRENEKLVFNWTQLDQVVEAILKTGSLPFFSLSFMPPAIAREGEITNPPQDWSEWQMVVRKTIEHYSGFDSKNLTDVAYEVWSEPDLFGNWKIGGQKDYRTLYFHAALGAQEAENVNPFKIGGPASTALYQTWVDKFLDYINEENLRFDFYSWHRYSLKPQVFLDDVNQIDSWLTKHGGYSLLPKYLTEWGSDSENSPLHDQSFDAAHLVAVLRQLLQRIDLAFIFEIRDGPSPEGKKYWGRWGLLTHSGEPKPKYQAFSLLNQMSGKRIKIEGEGTWVTGFAARNNQNIFLILANLDKKDQHQETVPITFLNLEKGQYLYEEFSLESLESSSIETINSRKLKKQVLMSPNQVTLIKLTKTP